MPLVGLSRRWRRQPPEGYVRLRESHWLTRDLLFVDSGLTALYRGEPTTPLQSTTLHKPGGRGDNAPFRDSVNLEPDGSGIDLYAIDEVAPTGLTLSAWCTGPAGTTNDPLLGVGSSVNGYVMLRRSSAEAMQAGSSTAGGSLASATASGGFVANEWSHGVAVFNSATSRAAFCNGGNKGTNGTNNAPGNLNRVVPFAAYRGGTASAICSATINRVALPMVIGRALSDAEVRALYEEQLAAPWDIFERRTLWFPITAAGGGSWNVAISEAATPADACTATFSPSASIDETTTPSDISTAAIDAVAALVETTSPTDLATAAATLLRAIAEQATPADAATASFSGAGSAAIVETATPSDAITAAATLLRQVAESTTPSDQATAAATLVRLITEQAVPVDQATVQGGDAWTVSIEELATAIDVITATFTGGAAALLSAPPIGHGPDLARRVVAALASRRPNLSSRTR